MQDSCPVCLKNGKKQRLKLFQINFKEGVWLCENMECLWPVGYEDVVFCPREIGEIWSCYWNDYEALQSPDTSFLEPSNTPLQNIKNTSNTKGTPKITSIEKTNIDISNVKNKKFLNINKAVNGEKTISTPEIEILQNSEPINNDKNAVKSNLKVTTMKIDGLPPITLSFEIPTFNTTPETVMSNMQETKRKNNKKKSKRFSLRYEMYGPTAKDFPKFGLEELRKHMELQKSTNANNSNNDSSNIETSAKTQGVESNSTNDIKKGEVSENDSSSNIRNSNEISKTVQSSNSIDVSSTNDSPNIKINSEIQVVENNFTDGTRKQDDKENFSNLNIKNFSNDYGQTAANVSTTYIPNQLDNSLNYLPNQGNMTSNTSAANTSLNIDNMLEGYLNNDHNVSEDINDDWLDSLLS